MFQKVRQRYNNITSNYEVQFLPAHNFNSMTQSQIHLGACPVVIPPSHITFAVAICGNAIIKHVTICFLRQPSIPIRSRSAKIGIQARKLMA